MAGEATVVRSSDVIRQISGRTLFQLIKSFQSLVVGSPWNIMEVVQWLAAIRVL